MSFGLTIAGVAKSLRAGTLQINYTANGRSTASFRIDSADGSYRPPLDAAVVITENGVTIFAGLVTRPREVGLFNGGGPAAISTTITASDYNLYAERRFVNETLAAGTMKSMLTTLVATYLSTPYGVSLHGSQVDGPSFPELKYEDRRLDEVLNELVKLTADAGQPFVWNIDASKVLRLYQPSTTAAPFNISSNNTTDVIGDIEVEINREHYANRIILRIPSKTELNRAETFTANGTDYQFTPTFTVTKINRVLNNGVQEPHAVEGEGFDLAATWLLDPVTNEFRRVEQDVANPPAAGTITFEFDGVFNGRATAEDAAEIAAHGLWEKVVVVESAPSDTTAQALADAELAKSIYESKAIKYRTHTAGIWPGQSQTITATRRNISVTAVITEVSIRDVLKDRLERSVTAYADGSQSNLDRSWQSEVKAWRGDKTGGAVKLTPTTTVGTGTVMSNGAAPPNRAIQRNKNGGFFGSEEFIYYEDEKSLLAGDGSVISAAAFSHCYILGENLEIADA